MVKGWVDHKNSTFPVFCLGVFLWHGINNQTQILTYLNCVLSVTEWEMHLGLPGKASLSAVIPLVLDQFFWH